MSELQTWVDGYVYARELETQAKRAKNIYKVKIQEYMEDREMESVKVPSGSTAFFGEPKTRFSFPKEVEDQMFDWLEANSFGGVIKGTVHHQTLNKVLQDAEEQGIDLPEFVKRFEDRGFQVRRGNGAALDIPEFQGIPKED